jgi:hypothetical protein
MAIRIQKTVPVTFWEEGIQVLEPNANFETTFNRNTIMNNKIINLNFKPSNSETNVYYLEGS